MKNNNKFKLLNVGLFMAYLIILFPKISLSQENPYIYLEDNKFHYQCEEYYPLSVNYLTSIVMDDATNEKHVAPYYLACKEDDCFGCGQTIEDYHDRMREQFEKMVELGINSIRLVKLEVVYDTLNECLASLYWVTKSGSCLYYTEHAIAISDEASFHQMALLIQEVVDIINDKDNIYDGPLELKVMLLTGAHGVEILSNKYTEYLAYIANYFKDEPTIFAYDFYNEPIWGVDYNDFNKAEKTNIVIDWHNAIKDNAPAHLTTIGHWFPSELYYWDAQIMPIDFPSFHIYEFKKNQEYWEIEPVLKRYRAKMEWLNNAYNLPLITIGETGSSGTDEVINPEYQVGSEAEQALFLEEGLKYSKWNNVNGFAWWCYSDNNYGENTEISKVKGHYFGVVEKNDNLETKLSADLFGSFDPYTDCPDCELVDPDVYLYPNPLGTEIVLLEGTITNSQGIGIKDAYIQASIFRDEYMAGAKHFSYARTNENGEYKIKTRIEDPAHVKALICSYPGMETVKKTNNEISNPLNITLGDLDQSLIAVKPNLDTYIIESNQNEIWETAEADDIRYLPYKTIIIEDNATLTVTANVFLANNAKIILHKGGKLTLDGGKLSADCYWQGISIEGSQTILNNPDDQGLLVMKNGATIENAMVGVANYHLNAYGGIIRAEQSNFINNKIAVQIRKTKYDTEIDYFSYFEKCTFEVNNNYHLDDSFRTFADLSWVNDVIFKLCDFKNSTSTYLGKGILAREANFVVNSCTFKKLKNAIQNYGSGSSMGSHIFNSTFNLNHRSIYVTGINEMKITNDTISIGPKYEEEYSHGIYLERCNGYLLEANHIKTEASPFEEYRAVGLYIKNSGSDNNEVYENKFENLDYGAIAYGRNRHGDEPSGLCFKCNEFANNQYDIAVFGDKAEDGIRDNQGSNALEATAPAANLFSTSAGSIGLENQGTHFNYWLPLNTGTEYQPYIDNGPITYKVNEYEDWTYEDNCPPSGGGNGGITTDTERSAMASNEAKSDSTQNILDLLVDGGDTQGTTQDVETAYPPETYQVYNELMNKSPYLSDNVVKASIEKEEVLPNVMIRDIMVANPQSAKEKDLMDKIDERTTPMPDYMKAQILAGKDLVGYMEKLESEKGHYAQKRATAYHNLIRLYQQDSLLSTDAKLDSVIALVSNENTLFAQYRLVMLYFAKEDYSVGQNILSAIPNTFTLNAEQSTEHSYFTDYYQIATDLAISGNPITDQQISDLEYIVTEEAGLSAAYARNLLIAHNAMDYVEEVIIPQSLHFAAHPQEEALQEALEAHSYLNLYPNPAKDYLIVKYELEMEYADAQLQIYDSKGSLIKTIAAENIQDQKVISTTDFKAGTYYIHLYFNHKEMESQKFTVVK